MSLSDHHQRLGDLEAAFTALRQALIAEHPALEAELRGAARRLHGGGARGAADLLRGDPMLAAYRR
jgi:hypothetical protein